MASKTKVRTRKQIVNDFIHALHQQHSDLKKWAKENGYKVGQVYSVTRGQNKGTRGTGREISEKIGLDKLKGEQA